MALQDYYNTGGNGNSLIFNGEDYQAAQTFTAGATYDITSVRLQLGVVNGYSGSVVVEIQETCLKDDDSNVP